MKKLTLFFLIIFVLTNINSQEDRFLINSSNFEGINLKIELANPKIYKQGDDILIKINIYNPTELEKNCFIASDKKYSFDFEMVTMQNRVVDHRREHITSFNRVQPIFYNMLKFNTNEGYTYEVVLNDFFNLDIAGQFFIRAYYYPNLKKSDTKNETVVSNQLTINIRPKDAVEDYIVELENIEEEKKLHAEKKSPDDVIKFMLESRMQHQWEKFFLYIDIEKILLQNSVYRDKYRRSDIEKKRELLGEYKEYLKQNNIDTISYLPHSFKVMRTEYTEGKAKVEVIVDFKYLDYVERKYYTYFLFKKGSIWFVESYEVMNLGAK